MGEEDQEQKHVCKFCKKSFPCGRSLGGHMRSHMINNNKNSTNSAAAAEAKNNNNKKKLLSSVNEFVEDFEGEGGHVGYVLRENPKKTWRLSDSIDETYNNNNHCGRQEKLCKECGKGFQSWKALFGHMRCHSDKEKISNYSLDGNSWNAQNQKLVIDSQSDNEGTAAAPRRRRRSRRTRFRTTTITAAAAAATVTTTTTTTTTTTAATTTTSSFSFANASPSSASEIEQEQEEVALCLMMLSRDVGCWRGGGGGLNNSVADSSDNNSVVVEVRSSGLVKRITETEDWNGYESNLKMKQSVVSSDLENGRFERKVSEIGGSNFGVVKNGFNKIHSEVSVDGFFGEDKIKNPRQDDEAGIEASDAELGKNITCQNDLESGGKYDLSKKSTGYDPFDLEIGKVNCSLKKTSKFECTTCNKIFHSYQALGGHRASHKKIKGCYAAKTETSENSIETDVSPDPIDDIKLIKSCENQSPIGNGETSNVVKRSKHECPICFKIFASGQALGGHKRSHVVENNEARGNQSNVIQQNLPEIRDLLDLNLPAPIDQEDANSSHIGLKPWWIESKHKRESVIAAGVISN